jgi:ATP-binding cassette subfamily C protein CydCD
MNRKSRGPLDRRLLRLGRPGRLFAAAVVLLGGAAAALVAVRALVLADIVADVWNGAALPAVSGRLIVILSLAAGSAAIAWLTEVAAHRAAAGVKSALRRRLLAEAAVRRPSSTGLLAARVGRGIDALDTYFSRYLPALGLTVVVPAVVVIAILPVDLLAALIVLGTLPLIPVFAALIGAAARPRAARQWRAFSELSAALLEGLRSLPTLKVFGRTGDLTTETAALADRHRQETMGALRVAFLSALVLELAATISVAVIAVAVGLRVLSGGLDLEPALAILILAPEAYLPLRRVAAEFHAAAEGAAVADEVLAVTPPAAVRAGTATPHLPAPIEVAALVVRRPGRTGRVLDGASLSLIPGEHVAVVGASGAGKSTLLAVLLGLVVPDSGKVLVGGTPLDELDPEEWLRATAWVGQDPHLFDGTVADNVRFGDPGASDDAVAAALDAAGADFVAALDGGTAAQVGERGVRLSAGERSRIALARAFLRRAPLLLLDEPSAHLDPVSEQRLGATLDGLRGEATVVVVAHRPAMARRADRIMRLAGGRLTEVGP